jgi:hypothetical protein
MEHNGGETCAGFAECWWLLFVVQACTGAVLSGKKIKKATKKAL